MIDIQEIRVGNWFIGYDNLPFQWTIEHFGYMLQKKNAAELDEIIKSGITLTGEVLLKCGFFTDDENFQFVMKTDEFEITMFFCDGWHFLYESIANVPVGADYVQLNGLWDLHQFQNLIFDISGKELEYEK